MPLAPSAIPLDLDRLRGAAARARRRLLDERNEAGHWTGELASSPLSTATAVSALCEVARRRGLSPSPWQPLVEAGCRWLDGLQNEDGGWGDTDRSHSNIATTMLARAAYHLAGAADSRRNALERAVGYIRRQGGVDGLRRRYGRDKTFAVPILSNCAIAGLADWRDVSPLPFELACFPQAMYRFLQLPVVSYAIPALVAIGQARHFLRPSPLPWVRGLRAASVGRSLRVLRRMQPASGGYLEATPLTSFVVMNLAASGRGDHEVARQGVQFLEDSVRADGSWPIDTNLATWNTTLAVNALAAGGDDVARLDCLPWLLDCQHLQPHPFTGADPGGWGWTDLSGAVPDSDDTPGALLALAAWRRSTHCGEADRRRIEFAAARGVEWLLRLQNRDGGWPTFCRGWGKLPFDRSGADLTAHALRALQAWKDRWPRGAEVKVARGIRYLLRQQRGDGSWVPLWFGNQDHPDEENTVYGTAKVMLSAGAGLPAEAAGRGARFLRSGQSPDGGWGAAVGDVAGAEPPCKPAGRSSLEETSLAVEALLAAGAPLEDAAVSRGLQWIIAQVERDQWGAAPIGFYFAKLWYHERLYPLIFAAATLGRAARLASPPA